ncbi:MAG: hypothetical protein U5Q44_00995 [Dehalococcoidia bacterium]|nr:hypothetical protein [Dehalococcoidia bacterium]
MAAIYRADHVGSLLRPQEILDARAQGVSGDALREIEDRHIRRVLERQRDVGLKIYTDGEFRRRTFMSDFNDSVEGLDEGDAVQREWKGDASGTPVTRVSGIATRRFARCAA